MSDFNQAADQIRRLAQKYKDMQAAADVLDGIGQLDQTITEKHAAIAQADLDLIAAKQAVKAMQDQSALIIQSAQRAAVVVSETSRCEKEIADQDIEKRRVECDNECSEKVIATQVRVDKLIDEANAQIAPLTDSTDKLRTEIASLTASVADKTVELNNLTAAIVKARAQVAALLGA